MDSVCFCPYDNITRELIKEIKPPHSPPGERPRAGELSMYRKKNASCRVSLTTGSGFYARHYYNTKDTLTDLVLILKHADWILRSMDLDGDGQKDGLTLRIRSVTLKKDTHVDSGRVETEEPLSTLAKDFKLVPQDDCLSLMFVSLPMESNFVSMAYGDGVCKNNDKELEPARNVAIINSLEASGSPRPLFVTAWAATMAIGHVMGSAEWACDTEAFYPPQEDWISFFSDCGKANIAKVLEKQGSCLEFREGEKETLSKPTNKSSPCGNGEVDDGEECDCGNKEQCKSKSSCCVPPGSKDECRYDRTKGYECDWPEDCCTRECKIVPKSWKQFCGSGDASCAPTEAYCDGDGPHCPVPRPAFKLKDGEMCGPANLKQAGAATCKGGRCTGTVCTDAGLEDCTCVATSGQECHVCCKKKDKGKGDPELCVPVEYFGLKPKKGKFFHRYPGTPCSEVRFGHCNKFGACTQFQTLSAATRTHTSHYAIIFALVSLFISNSASIV